MRILTIALAAFVSSALCTANAQFSATGIPQKPQPAQPPGKSAPAKVRIGVSGVRGGGSLALVGGSDSCATPEPIAGQGSFPYDLTTATTGTEGQTEWLCYSFGYTAIDNDVWFAWTADATGTAIIDTCGSTVDTKIAVYPGSPSCPTPGTALTCSDDYCGLQSWIIFPVTAGTIYILQVGTYPGAAAGTGTLNVLIIPPVGPEDNCATPMAIGGTGSFPFDLVGATTGAEGQAEALCYSSGTSGIDSDVWYTWTAPSTNTFSVTTCNTTSADTKLAVYPGAGCPTSGSALACNDDTCGLQSSVQFAATAGNTYTIQLGTFPGASQGFGSFEIAPFTPVPGDDCNAPIAIAGQGNFSWDNTNATTGAEGQFEALCYTFYTTAVYNDIWYAWTADQSGDATVTFCLSGATTDTKMAAYPGSPSCPLFGTALACNDDSCGLQSEITFAVTAGSTYMLQIGTWSAWTFGVETFDISIGGGGNPRAYCFGDGTGAACPCGNLGTSGRGCDNGTGSGGGLLTATGTASIAAGNWTLVSQGLEPTQPALYFQGDNAVAGGLGVPFGDGLRCAGGNVVRLQVRVSDVNGDSATTVDIASKGGVVAGDTKRYQCWYRNPNYSPCGTGFNLTNGLEVTWLP